MTFVTEFIDRLTGPSTKAKKAVEDLGKASENAAKTTDGANKRVEQSERRRAKTARDTATTVAGSERRRARATQDTTRATGLVRAQGMAKDWNSAMDSIVRRTAGSVSKVENTLSRMGSGAKVGGSLVGGMALAGGAKRIADVQQANVVMETMGMSEKDRSAMMGQFKGLAQDTPFSTGSIASLGSGLISSGMDQSKVHDALQGAIDTSATYGMSPEEMALLLKQIQAKGKAQGDDMMQLMDRNIPMMDWIAKQKGVDKSQVQDLVSKGQASSDDVFAALAANSQGGAEKAAGTLKGSFTNFTSSVSQAGEAFLSPMTDDLTEFLQVAKDSVNSMKPALSVLGEFGGILLKVLKPTLPVLIPLIAAGGAAFTAYRSVKTATALLGFFAGRRGVGGVVEALLGSRGATGAASLFVGSLRGMRDGAREAYGQRGLGGLNAGLDTSTRKIGKAQGRCPGLTKGFGLLGVAAGGASTIGAAWGEMQGDINTSQGKVDNAAASGGGIDALNSTIQGAPWNKLSTTNNAFAGNSGRKTNNVGEAIAEISNANVGSSISNWAMNGVGIGTKDSGQKETISQMDSMLAGKVQAGDLAGAGSLFNQIAFQTEAAGKTQQDAMALFPQYKDALYGVFSHRHQTVDDNQVLQAMRSDKGFRSGGFTGMGSASGVAGVVHGREYVMPEFATSRPGMLPALRQIHRTGELARRSQCVQRPPRGCDRQQYARAGLGEHRPGRGGHQGRAGTVLGSAGAPGGEPSRNPGVEGRALTVR